MAKQNLLKRILTAGLAAGCLCVSAAAFSDTDDHWAKQSISKWSEEYSIIKGYEDGTFRPDASITRGAFAGILDRFMKFQTISPAETFSDTEGIYWEKEILKLHASGVYLGNNGKALAGSDITRQQAVTMLGRAFRIEPTIATLPYADAEQVAAYAVEYVAEFTAQGYLDGNRTDYFRPTEPITRAEIISILDHMVQTLVQENTTLTEDVYGTLMINAAEGAALEDMTVHGDLIIAPGVQAPVTIMDSQILGKVCNFSDLEPNYTTKPPVVPEEPENTVLKPSDIYTPGVLSGEYLDYSGYKIPIYEERAKNVFQDSDFVWNGDRIEYVGRKFKTRFGVDVSSWQGDIDWEAVAGDGVDFAMVRIGLRGTSTGALQADRCYEQNIDGAMAAGLATGVYFFAQAITIEEAIEEADFVLSLLNGRELSGPVCYDWEMHNATYRVYGTSPEMATACAVAFCQRIAEAGYTPMVYAGNYVSYIKYDQGALAPYLSWYPEYKSESSEHIAPGLVYHMDYWQFSDRCTIAGIEGRVDVNLQFIRK